MKELLRLYLLAVFLELVRTCLGGMILPDQGQDL